MSYSRRMSHLDAAIYSLETPTSHMHLGMLARFEVQGEVDGPKAYELLKKRLKSNAAGFNSLNLVVREQLAGLVPPLLVDDENQLDLAYHLRFEVLETDLDTWIGLQLSIPLDASKPLWRLVVVDGLGDNTFGLMLIGHHGVFDGVAALRVALDLICDQPRLVERRRNKIRDDGFALARSSFLLLSLPVFIGRSLWLHVKHARERRGSEVAKIGSFRSPKSILNCEVESSVAVARVRIASDKINEVRRDANVTATDVILAVLSGGLRSALGSRNKLPRKSLVALIPSAQSGAEWGGRAGNRLGFWFVSLETDVEKSSDRLRRIADSSRRARVDLRMRGVDLWEKHARALPPRFLNWLVRKAESKKAFSRLTPLVNLIVAHVVGPKDIICLGDAKLTEIWPFGPVCDGGAFNTTVVSMGEEMFVGIATTARLGDIAHDVADALPQSLNDFS